MTEEQNDIKTEPSGTLKVEVAVQPITDPEARPPWRALTVLYLLHDALSGLRDQVKTQHGGVVRKNIFAQLDYNVEAIPTDVIPDKPEGLTEEDLRILAKKVADHLGEKKAAQRFVMQLLTRGVALKIEDDGNTRRTILPPDLYKEVMALPVDKREERQKELAGGWEWGVLAMRGEATTPAGPQRFQAGLVFAIRPLCIIPKLKFAFYSAQVGLVFQEGDPSLWSEEHREELWAALFGAIDDMATPYIKELEAEGELRPPIPKPDRVRGIREEDFPVAAGFVPMHQLFGRSRSGLPLFPEQRRQFYELRTSLNWAVGLALFSRTCEKTPGDWQEVPVGDLTDCVFCLTERDASRRGDHRTDVLAELVKLHTTRNAYVRYDWERRGRAWHKELVLGSDYAIPNLELVYLDRKTRRRVLPSDPALRSEVVPLEVKGRRAFTPDGKDINALPLERWTLDRIRWRWNPSFVDDLLNAPALDGKGKLKRDAKGKILRTGYNIRVAVRIFDALRILRTEGSEYACRLLVLLAHDIYKPPKQSTAAGRNMIEREADRLFDLLGMEADPKHPERREEVVARAVYRLKQPDIGALLPGSDERPRDPSEAERASGRRKSPYYRFMRSPDYTPKAALVTKEEADFIEAGSGEAAEVAPEPLPLPDPKADQVALPGLEEPPAPSIPSGNEVRAAREAAGLNIRRFAERMDGPSFNTWARYERGEAVRVGSIPAEVWQRVRDFIDQHGGTG